MLNYIFPTHAPATVKPGDVFTTWCSVCMTQTDHVYRPGSKKPLECLGCKTEAAK